MKYRATAFDCISVTVFDPTASNVPTNPKSPLSIASLWICTARIFVPTDSRLDAVPTVNTCCVPIE
jgi:hypothetical protein